MSPCPRAWRFFACLAQARVRSPPSTVPWTHRLSLRTEVHGQRRLDCLSVCPLVATPVLLERFAIPFLYSRTLVEVLLIRSARPHPHHHSPPLASQADFVVTKSSALSLFSSKAVCPGRCVGPRGAPPSVSTGAHASHLAVPKPVLASSIPAFCWGRCPSSSESGRISTPNRTLGYVPAGFFATRSPIHVFVCPRTLGLMVILSDRPTTSSIKSRSNISDGGVSRTRGRTIRGRFGMKMFPPLITRLRCYFLSDRDILLAGTLPIANTAKGN